ncbi:hypothetical protein ASG81_04270 [Paenibacillus sp. Soil522]|nr:hypothetical protein ASG81_04270 [Paenibacillus sp. Soil522]
MESILQENFPEIYGRVDLDRFSLVDEAAYLQAAITPVIHRPYLMLNGTLVLGCGDSVFLADPVTGQGCNTASYCAEQLFETLMAHKESPWDEKVGIEYWSRTRPYLMAVTEWTNAMTGPLPEHIVQMPYASSHGSTDRRPSSPLVRETAESSRSILPSKILQRQSMHTVQAAAASRSIKMGLDQRLGWCPLFLPKLLLHRPHGPGCEIQFHVNIRILDRLAPIVFHFFKFLVLESSYVYAKPDFMLLNDFLTAHSSVHSSLPAKVMRRQLIFPRFSKAMHDKNHPLAVKQGGGGIVL